MDAGRLSKMAFQKLDEGQRRLLDGEFRDAVAARTEATSLNPNLAIGRGITHSHKGKIWIESSVGNGSTLFFPLFGCDRSGYRVPS